MTRLFIAAFSGAVLLLMAMSTNAGLDEELVFYLTFDNVKDQTIVDKSKNGLDAELPREYPNCEGQIRECHSYYR